MTKISFNRMSDWVKARAALELRYIIKDQRNKPPVGANMRHNSPEPDRDRVILKATQSRLVKMSKVKPSMPRMPWEDKP